MNLPDKELLIHILKFSGYGLGMIVLFMGIHFVVYRVAGKYAAKREYLQLQYFLKKTGTSTRWFLVMVSLMITLAAVPQHYDIHVARHVLLILIIINISWVIAALVSFGLGVLQEHYNVKTQDNLEARKKLTQLRIIERIIVTLVFVVGIASALLTIDKIKFIGINLLTTAGIAGIIVGFAAQKSLSLVFAGFQIAFSQPIRLDDVLIVEGEWGRVEEITLTYVVVKIWDERRLIVPINYFLEKPFQNWTRTNSDIIGSVFLYTDYRFPVDELRKYVGELVRGNENWDGKVSNVQVTDSSEKTMTIRILASSADSSKNWNLRTFIREKLINYIKEKYPDFLPTLRLEMKPMENG